MNNKQWTWIAKNRVRIKETTWTKEGRYKETELKKTTKKERRMTEDRTVKEPVEITNTERSEER